MTRALIVVDVQNDFVEGGSLAVIGGLTVAYRIADGLRALEASGLYDYVVATKDFHNPPPDTNNGHFGNPPDFVDSWPVHCVAFENGSEFATPIQQVSQLFDAVFYKGQGEAAYSGFEGNIYSDDDVEGLYDWLTDRGVTHVDLCGIATDYCVRATAKHSVVFGFNTRIVPGWCAAVGGPEAHERTIKEVEELNARLQEASSA